MPDRTHVELIFLDTEGGFGLGELDISLPELLIAPIGDIRAQQIGASESAAQSSNSTLQTTRSRKPAGQLSSSSATAKRAAARWFCWRMRPICRFSGAGSRRFFERAMRAARRSSVASIRRLNLSCIARSLLR